MKKIIHFTSKQLEIFKRLIEKEIFCVEDDITTLDDDVTEQELKDLLTKLTSVWKK